MEARQPPSETAMVGKAENDASLKSFRGVGYRYRSLTEAQAMITEASTRIIEQGFDAAMFTPESISSAFFPIKSYLKLTKQFMRHEDRSIRDGLLSHGISNNIIKKPDLATILDVIKFLIYLRSPVGQLNQLS